MLKSNNIVNTSVLIPYYIDTEGKCHIKLERRNVYRSRYEEDYTFLGGHFETIDTSHLEILLRELREETGNRFDLTKISHVGFTELINQEDGKIYRTSIFAKRCDYLYDPIAVGLNDTIWILLEDAYGEKLMPGNNRKLGAFELHLVNQKQLSAYNHVDL